MKKLILALAVIFGVIAFSSCKKENVQPTVSLKAKTLASGDIGVLSQADFNNDPTTTIASGDKGTLSQADGSGN